jgi:carboxyl-terminal processing protease
VDHGTSGSSELLAAALRDYAGAKLVGTTTFGDGTEQELIRLENGAGISITRAKMLTSKGVDFDGKGLQADLPATGDPIDAAVKALSGPSTVRNK